MMLENKKVTIGCKLIESEKETFLKTIEPFYEGSVSKQLSEFFKDVIAKKWIKHVPSAVSFQLRKSCYNLDCRSLNVKENEIEGNMTEGECLECGTKWLITKKAK